MNGISSIFETLAFENQVHGYDLLFVDRGPVGGNMTTDAVSRVVSNQKNYQIAQNGLKESISDLYAIDLESRANHPEMAVKPPCLEIEALWDETPFSEG